MIRWAGNTLNIISEISRAQAGNLTRILWIDSHVLYHLSISIPYSCFTVVNYISVWKSKNNSNINNLIALRKKLEIYWSCITLEDQSIRITQCFIKTFFSLFVLNNCLFFIKFTIVRILIKLMKDAIMQGLYLTMNCFINPTKKAFNRNNNMIVDGLVITSCTVSIHSVCFINYSQN